MYDNQPATSARNAPPAAAPIDTDSVAALMALDKAMETVAARVTPAVVNVTVTSKSKPEVAGKEMPEGKALVFSRSRCRPTACHSRQHFSLLVFGSGQIA